METLVYVVIVVGIFILGVIVGGKIVFDAVNDGIKYWLLSFDEDEDDEV